MRVACSQFKKLLPGLDIAPQALADLMTHQGLVVKELAPVSELFSPACLAATFEEGSEDNGFVRCTLKAGPQTFHLSVEPWGVPLPGSRVLVNPVGMGMHVLPLAGLPPLEHGAFLITLPLEIPEGERIPGTKVLADQILECEVTANRGDCLSVLGLAREIAAGMDLDLVPPETDFVFSETRTDFTLENQDADDLCPYYTGRLIRNVTVRPSPWSVILDLLLLGLRPINNVVDYTNLAMMEFGQPLHAFDASTLRGRGIVVRRARRGEQLVTLDGIKRELSFGMLVIADRERPVAVAGVMGGQMNEVVPATREIFLEAAVFDGPSVRKTTRSLGMRTDASARFERGIDCRAVIPASSRVLHLLDQERSAVEVLSPWLENGGPTFRQREISLNPEYIGEIMAFPVNQERTRRILNRLGFRTEETGDGALRVSVPSWRADVGEAIDLAEEVGRVAGYRHIHSMLPEVAFDPGNRGSLWPVKAKLRSFLADRGFYEVVTISLLNRETVRKAGFREEDLACVINPLVHDQRVLRPSLLLSSLDTLRTNITRGRDPVGIFEIGDVFLRTAGSRNHYAEESRLFLALNGSLFSPLWQDRSVDLYFELKGLFESILDRLGIDQAGVNMQPEEDPTGLFNSQRSFTAFRGKGEDLIGWGGSLRDELASVFGFWGIVYCLELRLSLLGELVREQSISLDEVSRFPAVRRDVSLLCPITLSWQTVKNLLDTVSQSKGMALESFDLFDCYQGKSLPVDRKSLSFSMVFRSLVETLTDQTVDQWVSEVKEALKTLDGVLLREELNL
ncbi:MAG TPA: phenylalanine--tRNA ligase subunit beta [Atribacteraceae bacterium]|nr:phenylalanine--tRNA ligase subunit beta [Atribacteraceae bacterium]